VGAITPTNKGADIPARAFDQFVTDLAAANIPAASDSEGAVKNGTSIGIRPCRDATLATEQRSKETLTEIETAEAQKVVAKVSQRAQ
jgi:hypothetical protein